MPVADPGFGKGDFMRMSSRPTSEGGSCFLFSVATSQHGFWNMEPFGISAVSRMCLFATDHFRLHGFRRKEATLFPCNCMQL